MNALNSFRPNSLLVGVLFALFVATSAHAQFGGNCRFRGGAVGGISINTEGVVAGPVDADLQELRQRLRQNMAPVPGDLNGPTKLRFISLKRLDAAVETAWREHNGRLPDEIRYLAGLQRVQYVFVYPEENDVVIAGPAEGWKISDQPDVVGVTTGRPVVFLDDLLIAFRSTQAAREGQGISCSIDPTPEGRRNFQAFMDKHKVFSDAVLPGIEQALGPQQVTITGVPATCHFARVMLAADYRMKRFAMALEQAPVKLQSYIALVGSANALPKNMMPRWWLACNYEPLSRSEDGLAWELKGRGVKAMAEDDFVTKAGKATATGKANPLATTWADQMTAVYDELAGRDSVFGDLRNVMDLCVVAALIEKEDLLGQAHLNLPTLIGSAGDRLVDQWGAPKTVATQCSLTKRGKNFIITASGGVQVDSWDVASKVAQDQRVGQVRPKSLGRSGWWWN